MSHNPSHASIKLKKVPSLFTFIPELVHEQDLVSVEFFHDTLHHLETIYRNQYQTLSSSSVVEEMRKIQKIYNSRGLNIIHWLIVYSTEMSLEHLNFFKFLYQIGMDFKVEDERGYHLLDLAIEKNHDQFEAGENFKPILREVKI